MADIFDLLAADPNKAKQPGAQKDIFDLMSAQDLALKTSSTGFAPAQPQSSLQVMETLNAPFDFAGDVAGRAVQNLVDPVKNPTLSDVAGGLTKAAIQYAGPQMVTSGVRGALKLGAMTAPGAQGGKMESLIGKTERKLGEISSRAGQNAWELKSLASQIPQGVEIPLSNTMKVIDDIIASHASRGITESPQLADAKRIQKILLARGGKHKAAWIDTELSDIGEKTGVVAAAGKMDPRYTGSQKAYKELFAAISQDLTSVSPVSMGKHTEYGSATVSRVGGQKSFDRTVKPYTDTRLEQIYEGGPMTAMPARGRTVQTQQFETPQLAMPKFSDPSQVDDVIQQTATVNTKYLTDPALRREGALPAGALIRTKDRAIRAQKSIEDVVNEFNNLVKTKRGQAGAEDINANQLIDKLQKNENLMKWLPHEDWREIKPLLVKLADTAALPAARGVGYGSGRALSRGAIAGGIASMTGMDPLTTAAAFTGIDYATGHLLMTRSGRSMVKAVLEMKAYSPSQKLNIINGMGLLAEKGINKAME